MQPAIPHSAELEAAKTAAHRVAVERMYSYCGPKMLVVGILRTAPNTATEILKALEVDTQELERRLLEEQIRPGNSQGLPTKISNNRGFDECIEDATKLAEQYKHTHVGVDLVFATLLHPTRSSSRLLREFGLSYHLFLREALSIAAID